MPKMLDGMRKRTTEKFATKRPTVWEASAALIDVAVTAYMSFVFLAANRPNTNLAMLVWIAVAEMCLFVGIGWFELILQAKSNAANEGSITMNILCVLCTALMMWTRMGRSPLGELELEAPLVCYTFFRAVVALLAAIHARRLIQTTPSPADGERAEKADSAVSNEQTAPPIIIKE